VAQVTALLNLPPGIQEGILLRRLDITERGLRELLRTTS